MCHRPPNALMPSPLVCPGPWSTMNVYRGRPANASCLLPSSRVMVENGATSALPVGGATGGQLAAQSPLQTECPGLPRSASKTYTVWPAALMKPGAPFNVIVASAAFGAGVGTAPVTTGCDGAW